MTPLPVLPKSNKHKKVKQMGTSRQQFNFGLDSPVARQKQLLLSEYLSDVVFQVGSTGQLIHAHKLILTIASEVFFAQFNGGFDEAKQSNLENPIIVEDIDPAIFTEVLRYIYCQKVDLTPDNIMDVYCASEKYLLTGLITVCKKFLRTTLNVKNVLKVFSGNRRYGFANVDELCLAIIRDNPIKCFQSSDFLTLSQPALELIAACRTMNCQKDQLETAFRKWCEANDSNVDIKPQLEALQCEKLSAFSAFRYDTDISTDLKINIKGKMHLHGLGIFIGRQPGCNDPTSVAIKVKIDPGNVTVARTVNFRKNLYVEEILFEKLTVTDECRIGVTFPEMTLFCLEKFKPVDTLGALDLTVTDMKFAAALDLDQYDLDYNFYHQSQPRSRVSKPRHGTNCVAYLLYSVDANGTS